MDPHVIQEIYWLPYPQNPITGNTPYDTGNATCTGMVIAKLVTWKNRPERC